MAGASYSQDDKYTPERESMVSWQIEEANPTATAPHPDSTQHRTYRKSVQHVGPRMRAELANSFAF